jgi:5'-3' exonuclease
MGIELVMVFDGAPMPCKQNTEEDRRLNREENLKKAQEFEKHGNYKESERYYTRAIDVTPLIAKEIIEEMHKYNIECIVAPYEADAQLAYLCKIGYVSGVISEDSDLIVFESPKVLYKLENTGSVKELLLEDLWNHPNYNLKQWSHERFVLMCVLAGCDYLKSCKNIGLKTAYKYVSQHPSLSQIILKLKRELGKIPEDYEEQFLKAIYSFKYHRVFCPLKGEMVHLNPVPEDLEISDLSFLGESFDRETMIGIARGRVHPFTKIPFDNSNLKRKINEIFEPLQKPTQIKKIKIADEIKTIAQKIRIEKQHNSKYFQDNKDMPDTHTFNPEKINPKLMQEFKPHLVDGQSYKNSPLENTLQGQEINLIKYKLETKTINDADTNSTKQLQLFEYKLTESSTQDFVKSKNHFLNLLETLEFKKIDLKSIFSDNSN